MDSIPIPSSILTEVVQFLDLPSIFRLRSVCKSIKRHLESINVWNKSIEKHFGTSIPNQLDFLQAKTVIQKNIYNISGRYRNPKNRSWGHEEEYVEVMITQSDEDQTRGTHNLS